MAAKDFKWELKVACADRVSALLNERLDGLKEPKPAGYYSFNEDAPREMIKGAYTRQLKRIIEELAEEVRELEQGGQ